MSLLNRTTRPPSSALPLYEVLREEHSHVRPGSGAEAAARGTGTSTPRPEDAAHFELVGKKEFVERVTKVAERVTEVAAPASAAPSPAGEPADRDLPYQRLAQWMAAAATGAPPGNADAGTVVLERPGVTADGICAALARKMEEADLPVEEPWIRDVALRPFTRGLLKRHLEQRRFFGRQPGPDPLLNRLLLEDAFAEYVRSADEVRLRAIFDEMRASGRAALCLSGGGIRSATFALGVVQGLARHGVLGRFSYLSTVSGGGYLGSWLSAWIHQEGFEGVAGKLDSDRTGVLATEAAPVQHLRQYSNYLSPRLGLLSSDTWTLVATLVRNLLLIWLVVVPLLAAIAGLPWLFAALAAIPSGRAGAGPWLAHLLVVTALLAAVLAVAAVRFVHAYRPESDAVATGAAAPASRRDQGAFLWQCLLPLLGAVVLWALAWRWFSTWTLPAQSRLEMLHGWFGFEADGPGLWTRGAAALAAGGALIHFVGWLLALWVRRHRRTGALRWLEPLVILVTGAVAGLLVTLTAKLLAVLGGGNVSPNLYASLSVPAYLLVVLLAGFAFEGLASRFTDDAEREWTARYSAWILIVAAGWMAVTLVILFGPHLARKEIEVAWGVGLGSGGLAAWLGRSSKTGGQGDGAGTLKSSKKRDWGGILSRFTLPIAAVAATVALVIALSSMNFAIMRWVCRPGNGWGMCRSAGVGGVAFEPETLAGIVQPWLPLALVTGMYVLGRVFARWVDTNRFSLHAMYRARLIRAYLGASRPAGERRPDPFTGFDDADNIHMGCLPEPAAGARVAPNGKAQPLFHVLNLALNLLAGRNLAWQERKAESFTVSPLHAGAMNLGYRRTRRDRQACPTPAENEQYYGGDRGISLGTAMTISGAAASPNMGYHSSPAITFLMTMFNARLGWWLGNPGPAGDRTFHLSAPTSAVRPILDEMLGRTTDTNEYVYLSDGGHFENLGLYEMVLRRNRFILVSDGSCDEQCTLQDLGNAIRKIRVDLGIPIEFDDDFTLRARSDDPKAPAGTYWALARIRYSSVDAPAGTAEKERVEYDGVLLYVKPGIYGGEPRDVFNYASANPAFPHETTADQFFSESQFESYRALGSHAVDRLARKFGGLDQLFTEPWWRTYLAGFGGTAAAENG